ncbi:hypothetical protein B5G34_05945 [Flavonifractor sp. An82]|nr:hypothetical protein B5G34_05945 [Flavonifractor sp. An82]
MGCGTQAGMPPAVHFRLAESGQRPIKAGDFDFPRLNNPPLETTKERELRFPLFGIFPRLFYCKLTGGGALLCNGPAAPVGCRKRPSGGYIQ